MQETRETQVQSLGQEDPLEEGMETHSSVLAWRIPWTEESDRLQSRFTKSWTLLSMHTTLPLTAGRSVSWNLGPLPPAWTLSLGPVLYLPLPLVGCGLPSEVWGLLALP